MGITELAAQVGEDGREFGLGFLIPAKCLQCPGAIVAGGLGVGVSVSAQVAFGGEGGSEFASSKE